MHFQFWYIPSKSSKASSNFILGSQKQESYHTKAQYSCTNHHQVQSNINPLPQNCLFVSCVVKACATTYGMLSQLNKVNLSSSFFHNTHSTEVDILCSWLLLFPVFDLRLQRKCFTTHITISAVALLLLKTYQNTAYFWGFIWDTGH